VTLPPAVMMDGGADGAQLHHARLDEGLMALHILWDIELEPAGVVTLCFPLEPGQFAFLPLQVDGARSRADAERRARLLLAELSDETLIEMMARDGVVMDAAEISAHRCGNPSRHAS
jgi:hypothetical protein